MIVYITPKSRLHKDGTYFIIYLVLPFKSNSDISSYTWHSVIYYSHNYVSNWIGNMSYL